MAAVFRTIDDRRGERPMFSVLNVEAQLPVLSDDELRQMRFWEEENLFRENDTSMYLCNPATLDDKLAAFYENGAWQTLETWVADKGLQYLELKKSPSGFTGATRLVEYIETAPYMRVQQPPGAGSTEAALDDRRRMNAPQPGTTVVVMAPSLSDEKREACLQLQDAGSPAELDVLRVAYSSSPAELVREWRDHHGELAARMGIIAVGDYPGQPTGDDLPEEVFVTTANPNDITGLGMRLNNYRNDGGDAQLVVCFDSITEMLRFAEMRPVFKFLHMFVGQIREEDGIGHFHLDPGAHDAQTISRLKPLFDDAVDVTG